MKCPVGRWSSHVFVFTLDEDGEIMAVDLGSSSKFHALARACSVFRGNRKRIRKLEFVPMSKLDRKVVENIRSTVLMLSHTHPLGRGGGRFDHPVLDKILSAVLRDAEAVLALG